jgi:hypothetical protein
MLFALLRGALTVVGGIAVRFVVTLFGKRKSGEKTVTRTYPNLTGADVA